MNSKRILWIDDDFDLLRPQRQNLVDDGYEVVTEVHIDSAINRLIEIREEYDGIILDIMMAPGEKLRNKATQGGLKTGLIFLRYLQKSGTLSRIKIFIFTHRYSVEDAQQAAQLNVGYHFKQDHKGSAIVELVQHEFGPSGK